MKCVCTHIFGILISLTLSSIALSQPKPHTQLSGTISAEAQNVSGATIILRQSQSNPLAVSISDTIGNYYFRSLTAGKYIIEVSAAGYGTYLSDTLVLKEGMHLVHHIILAKANIQLDEVVIQSKKDRISIENGKLVMNIQNSAVATGSTAFDALKNLPGVSIGQEEEIMLRGTSGVNIMLDGKMSYVSGKQLTALLKSIPAENLSKIELITAPTAEYDATGNAGIINVVTRKRKAQGYSIDLRSSISKGRYWMTNQNITALVNAGKFSINGSFDYNTPHSVMKGKSSNTITDGTDKLMLERNNESAYKINFYTYKLGLDWQFHPKHQLSLQYHGYLDNFKSPKDGWITKYYPDNSLHSRIFTTNSIIEPYYYDATNLSYVFNLDSSGKKWTTDFHYIKYRNNSDGILNTIEYPGNSNTLIENSLQSHQPGVIKIASAKTDFAIPYRNYLLKAGVKYATITNDNQFRFDSLYNGGFVEAGSMSNHFIYKEYIGAAYLSASRSWNKTTVEAGLRVEHTYAKGYTAREDSTNKWHYTKPFPSVSVNHSFTNEHAINIAISRRINRPGYSDLNPVRWYNDPYFYYSGNPELLPELAWLWSGAYTFKRKYVFTATYGHRKNYLTRRLVVDPQNQSIKSQSANFMNMQRLDLLFSAPIRLAHFWNIQWNAGINYTRYPISQIEGFKTLQLWAANFQVQQEIQLPHKFLLELNTYLYSDELWGLYRKEQVSFTDIGLKRSFLKNKLTIQGSFRDIFRSNRYKGVSQSNVTDYRYNDRPDTHRFGLSILYHLGGKITSSKANRIEEQDRL